MRPSLGHSSGDTCSSPGLAEAARWPSHLQLRHQRLVHSQLARGDLQGAAGRGSWGQSGRPDQRLSTEAPGALVCWLDGAQEAGGGGPHQHRWRCCCRWRRLWWPGLAWPGLAWPGLAWPGLAWPGPPPAVLGPSPAPAPAAAAPWPRSPGRSGACWPGRTAAPPAAGQEMRTAGSAPGRQAWCRPAQSSCLSTASPMGQWPDSHRAAEQRALRVPPACSKGHRLRPVLCLVRRLAACFPPSPPTQTYSWLHAHHPPSPMRASPAAAWPPHLARQPPQSRARRPGGCLAPRSSPRSPRAT
jgi:hypothetical protein